MLTNIETKALEAVCALNRKTKDNSRIDWEQRRYEAAKDILAGLCSNSNIKTELGFNEMADKAVALADALCDRLRKENN